MSYNPFHELQELHLKYDHLWSFVHKILEILKEMEARHIIDKERNQTKMLKKCKFYNRGFCREGNSCYYLHPEKKCEKHCEGKRCSEGSKCQMRHPHHCQHWKKGNCFRGEDCLYLHLDKVEDKCDDDSQNSDETTEKPLSTEEIYKLYENRTDLDDTLGKELSAEEIIELYENEKHVEETFVDANADDCTDDSIQLFKNNMNNKNQRNYIDFDLRKSTRKCSKSKRK
jgi:hypothetical protein